MEVTTKFGYIYKVTNIVNNKIYVGRKIGTNLDRTYYGSGTKIKWAIKEFGASNFKIEILEWCSTNDILKARERYWIELLDSTNPDIGYNSVFGGNVTNAKPANFSHIGVQVEDKLKEALQELAIEYGGTISSTIRMIVIDYLKRYKNYGKEKD